MKEKQEMKTMRPTQQVLMADLFPDWKAKFVDDTYTVFTDDHPQIPKLDPYFVFPEKATLETATILEKKERNNVWIYGGTGSGKTTLTKNLAAKVRARLWNINGTSHLVPSDVLGRPWARAGEITFRYGIIPKWLREGGWLLINEYDTLDAEVVNALKSCLEFPRHITLLENDDEVIYGNPDCRLIVTNNTQGRGDDSGMFVNTNVQSIADLRRFDAFIEVDYIDEESERKLLSRMFPDAPPEVVKNIVEVANRSREGYKKKQLGRVISTAECINWCENYSLFGTGHHSARISFLNAYEDEARMAMKDIINNIFGNEDNETLFNAKAAERASDQADIGG
jgi:cobaltochelatase CobS